MRQPLLCNATLNIHTDRGFLLLHRKPRTAGNSTSYLNLALKMRRQQATCRAGSKTGGTHAETEAQHRRQAPSAAHPKAPALRSESPRAGPSHTMLQLHKNFPLLSLLHLEKHPTDLGFMTRLSCFIVNSSKGKSHVIRHLKQRLVTFNQGANADFSFPIDQNQLFTFVSEVKGKVKALLPAALGDELEHTALTAKPTAAKQVLQNSAAAQHLSSRICCKLSFIQHEL